MVRFGWLLGLFLLVQCSDKQPRENDTLFQTSTINALLAGVYDGDLSLGALSTRGNFGIGTFHQLDGEMLVADGLFYQIRYDGKVNLVDTSQTTPFACITPFETDYTFSVDSAMTLAQLTRYIDSRLPSLNAPFAIRITGTFASVLARSVPPQKKPYPQLTQVTANQPTFQYESIEGELIGFRLPPFVAGLNVPGYHFHFLSADRTRGGHLLDCRIEKGSAAVDETLNLEVALLNRSDFLELDLSGDKSEELKKVE